jgi:hypothetical protein
MDGQDNLVRSKFNIVETSCCIVMDLAPSTPAGLIALVRFQLGTVSILSSAAVTDNTFRVTRRA